PATLIRVKSQLSRFGDRLPHKPPEAEGRFLPRARAVITQEILSLSSHRRRENGDELCPRIFCCARYCMGGGQAFSPPSPSFSPFPSPPARRSMCWRCLSSFCRRLKWHYSRS